ncbi:MAG: hypothetical protein AB1601_05020 [Planctomycetota bacterium]
MLTLAQLIKLVLDEAYAEIPGPDKDAAIKTELDRLTQCYGHLKDPARIAIDYSSPVARFAYIYKYTVAHADYIKQLIQGCAELQAPFKSADLSVAAIGGGPGSDLLGILKYMMRAGSHSTLTCYLFDRERAWGDSWSEVAKPLQANFQLYPVFQQLDVTDKTTWGSYRKFLNADLFTFSYFLSEVWTFRPAAEPFFTHCFSGAKIGSVFMFIDNNDAGGDFAGWFDTLAAAHGVNVVCSRSCQMAFSVDEEKTDLEPYYSKFGWPKRESNVSVRIGKKC